MSPIEFWSDVMADITVSAEGDIFNPNSCTFEERAEELKAIEAAEETERKRASGSPYKRWSQKNLGRTKELAWLALNYPAARAIMDIFEDRMDKRNGVVCSHDALCEILGISYATVKRSIKTLRDHGFIVVLKTGRENVYAINDKICWKNHGNKIWLSRFPADVILSLSEQDAEVREKVLKEAECNE